MWWLIYGHGLIISGKSSLSHDMINEFWKELFGKFSQYSDWLRAGRSRDQIPVGARFSAPVQTGPGAYPASCTVGTGSFPGVKSGRGVTLTPHPLLVPWSWKSRAIPLLQPMGRTACTESQCLYKGDLYLYSKPPKAEEAAAEGKRKRRRGRFRRTRKG